VSSKKKLIDYEKFFAVYRRICCKACVKVLSPNYKNYMFYYLKHTKSWQILSSIFSSKMVEIVMMFKRYPFK